MTTKERIQESLREIATGSLYESSIKLFETLGYNTGRRDRFDSATYEEFESRFLQENRNIPDIEKFKDKAIKGEWEKIELLFQLTDVEMRSQISLFDTREMDQAKIDAYLFFAIKLKADSYTRTALSDITRQLNRTFLMSVMVFFRYGEKMTISIIKRRLHKKDETKDVLEKVTLIKDINVTSPHRAHIEILFDLALEELRKKHSVTNFVELQNAWQETLDISELNRKFYREIANWYFWAREHVEFPDDIEKDREIRNSIATIRLLTRLVFVWFIKEKAVIPRALFNKDKLKPILKGFEKPEESTQTIFYKAILQNLFFATLSTERSERRFREVWKDGRNVDYGNQYVYRYESLVKSVDEWKELFAAIPFLNGGLFENLDRKHPKQMVDGFSEETRNNLTVPDYLFFSDERSVDLNKTYDTKGKTYRVKGLISILDKYKFTVAENTPIEEEIALDPELLGKVFENLLASFNPETRRTARKETGSFYTPREIVDYMVDESLIVYLNGKLKRSSSFQLDDLKQDACSTIFFDPNQEVKISNRNLPHWNQQGVMYFITFRLADSLPNDKLNQLKQERATWHKQHSEPYSTAENAEFHRLFSERVEQWLDGGSGSCCLAESKAAGIVATALKHFDGERYILDQWVVMPNHVHVLVTPIGNHNLSDILHSWKSFTGTAINKLHKKSGKELWQHESYDHIVRSEKQLSHFRRYILDNPRNANANVAQASSLNGNTASKDACATIDSKLRHLFAYTEEPHKFSEADVGLLIDAINTCKILDPACGSGAFPMGILHKLVFALGKLDKDNSVWKELQKQKALKDTEKALSLEDEKKRSRRLREIDHTFTQNTEDYGRKLYLIENAIYGVDIQPIAVQIAKLRFLISLIVDQDMDPDRDVKPLPNLETKFVAANTLVGREGVKAQMDVFDTQEIRGLENKLKTIRHGHFNARSPKEKKELRDEDKKTRNEIAELIGQSPGREVTAKQLASWDPYDQNHFASFFDSEWMYNIRDGFDIVIGNPPFVQIQRFSGKKEQEDWEKQNYETYVKTGDIYCLFYEKGNMLLRDKGVLTYITSNKWMRANYGKKLRKYFAEKTAPLTLIDFGGYKVFESSTVDTSILIFERSDSCTETTACTVGRDFTSTTDITDYLAKNAVVLDNPGEESWIISSKEEYAIRKRIEEIGTPLKEWDVSIYRGVLTGFNEAFIVDGAKKDELIAADPKNAEIIKPVLRGRDIKRYKAEFADLWLINTHNGYFDKETQRHVKPIDINNYPVIREHLDHYREKIEKRQDQGVTSYNLRHCAYLKEFEKEKIVWGNLSLGSRFAYSEPGVLVSAPCPMITPGNKYLLAVLNSRLGDHYIRSLGVTRSGGYFEYKPMFIEKVPVPRIPKSRQLPFETLVDCILFAKENDLETEARTFESVIDGMVYDLYFEEEMKKANCYITDRISEVIEPFREEDTDEFKTAYIKKLYDFCNDDKTVYRGLIYRRTVKVVKIVNGANK